MWGDKLYKHFKLGSILKTQMNDRLFSFCFEDFLLYFQNLFNHSMNFNDNFRFLDFS